MRTLPFVIALLVAIALPATTASGQSPAPSASPPAIKRTPLQKADVPAGTYEVVTGTAEIAANTNIGRHSHPGIETGYVLEGELTLLVEGQPPQRLKPGDSYKIPERAIHDARSGDKPAKVLAVYIVEKGKPLASAAE